MRQLLCQSALLLIKTVNTMQLRSVIAILIGVTFSSACSNQATYLPEHESRIAIPEKELPAPSASWLADYAAMARLHELAELAVSKQNHTEAAQYWSRSAEYGTKLPSETGLWMDFSAAKSRAESGDAKGAVQALDQAVSHGLRFPEFVERDPVFSAFASRPDYQAVLVKLRKRADSYRSDRADPENAKLVFDDVIRFWDAYDLASKVESSDKKAAIFRLHYLAPGTPGLIDYHWAKTQSMEKLVAQIEDTSKFYAGIRERSLSVARLEPQIREGLRRLEAIYPEAHYPNITFVIGRLNSGGTAGPSGMLIGLDVWSWANGISLEGISPGFQRAIKSNGGLDSLPYIVVHEQIHAMQGESAELSLLMSSLEEGVADFLAMMAMPNEKPSYYTWGLAHEQAIWAKFTADMDGKDISQWLANNDEGTDQWPADLGYFIGARICEAYYKQASDKQQAIRDLLYVTDPRAILEKSGYAAPRAQ